MIFDIERALSGRFAQDRLAVRQELSAPLVADLEAWMRENRTKLSRNSDVAEAMDYMLKAWPAFTAFLGDGRICLTNNAAEPALRGIALGRKSWLFAGSDHGGQRIRTIGIKRAEAKTTLANLTCNMNRLIFHERRAVMR